MTGRFAGGPTLTSRVHSGCVVAVEQIEDAFKSVQPCRRCAVYQEEKLRGIRSGFVGRKQDGLQIRIAVCGSAMRQPGIVSLPQRPVEHRHRIRIRTENERSLSRRQRAREKLRQSVTDVGAGQVVEADLDQDGNLPRTGSPGARRRESEGPDEAS